MSLLWAGFQRAREKERERERKREIKIVEFLREMSHRAGDMRNIREKNI